MPFAALTSFVSKKSFLETQLKRCFLFYFLDRTLSIKACFCGSSIGDTTLIFTQNLSVISVLTSMMKISIFIVHISVPLSSAKHHSNHFRRKHILKHRKPKLTFENLTVCFFHTMILNFNIWKH